MGSGLIFPASTGIPKSHEMQGDGSAAPQAGACTLAGAKAAGKSQILTLRAGLGTRNWLTRTPGPGSSLGTRVAGLETGPKQPPKPAREQRVTPVPSLCTLAHTQGSSGGSEGLTPPALSFSLLSLEPLALALIGCWCSGRGPNTCHPHFSTARRCLELSPMGQTPPAPKSQRPGCRRAPNQRRN